jgi:hypothetical protein
MDHSKQHKEENNEDRNAGFERMEQEFGTATKKVAQGQAGGTRYKAASNTQSSSGKKAGGSKLQSKKNSAVKSDSEGEMSEEEESYGSDHSNNSMGNSSKHHMSGKGEKHGRLFCKLMSNV